MSAEGNIFADNWEVGSMVAAPNPREGLPFGDRARLAGYDVARGLGDINRFRREHPTVFRLALVAGVTVAGLVIDEVQEVFAQSGGYSCPDLAGVVGTDGHPAYDEISVPTTNSAALLCKYPDGRESAFLPGSAPQALGGGGAATAVPTVPIQPPIDCGLVDPSHGRTMPGYVSDHPTVDLTCTTDSGQQVVFAPKCELLVGEPNPDTGTLCVNGDGSHNRVDGDQGAVALQLSRQTDQPVSTEAGSTVEPTRTPSSDTTDGERQAIWVAGAALGSCVIVGTGLLGAVAIGRREPSHKLPKVEPKKATQRPQEAVVKSSEEPSTRSDTGRIRVTAYDPDQDQVPLAEQKWSYGPNVPGCPTRTDAVNQARLWTQKKAGRADDFRNLMNGQPSDGGNNAARAQIKIEDLD